jgi:hypothetical protein
MKVVNWFADTFYRNRSNAWKAAVSTAVFSFVAVVLGSFLTLFSSLQDWIGNGDTEALLEDIKASAKVTLSAFIAVWTGIVNYVFRWVQARVPAIPGDGPVYGELPSPPPVEPEFPDEFA